MHFLFLSPTRSLSLYLTLSLSLFFSLISAYLTFIFAFLSKDESFFFLFRPATALSCLIPFLVFICLQIGGNSRPANFGSRSIFSNFVHPPSALIFPFLLYFLPNLCFLSPGLDLWLGQKNLSELILSFFLVRLAISFDLAAPLPFSISMGVLGSQFGMRTLFMLSILKPHITSFSPLVDKIQFLALFDLSFPCLFFFFLKKKSRILYPLTHTSLQPHSRPLSRKTSMPINPPRSGRLRNRFLIRTPSCGPRHARLSRTYCLRLRKS